LWERIVELELASWLAKIRRDLEGEQLRQTSLVIMKTLLAKLLFDLVSFLLMSELI
jgi:hypothetical protein